MSTSSEKQMSPFEQLGGDHEVWDDLPDDFRLNYRCDNGCKRPALKEFTCYLSDTPLWFYCSHECAKSHLYEMTGRILP